MRLTPEDSVPHANPVCNISCNGLSAIVFIIAQAIKVDENVYKATSLFEHPADMYSSSL